MVILQRLGDFRVHSPEWDTYITPETHKKEEAKKSQEPDVVDDFKETVVFLHKRADARRNSQWLWWHMQDLHKFKPDEIPAWRERRGHEVRSLT